MRLKLWFCLTLGILWTLPDVSHVCVVTADEKPAPKSSEKKKADEKPPLKIEKPFLWKVEKAESTDSAAKVSWLFGTIHVPDEEVTTLHPAAQAAFDQASAAYFEIDFLKATNAQMESISLPADKKLEDLIPEELVKRLDARLRKISPIANRTVLPPAHVGVWPLLLGNLDAQLRNLGKLPLDMLLYTNAAQNQKEVGGLEQATGQLQGIIDLPIEEQAAFLKATLDGMDKDEADGIDRIRETMELYASGDEEKFTKFVNDEFNRIGLDPKIAERIETALLGDRNKLMAEAAHKLMKDNPDKSYFFAVGLGHLVGKDTVQEFLQKEGYRITRVTEAEDSGKVKADD